MNDVVFVLEKKKIQNIGMGTSRFIVVSIRFFRLSLVFIELSDDSIHCVQKGFLKFFYFSMIYILAQIFHPSLLAPPFL